MANMFTVTGVPSAPPGGFIFVSSSLQFGYLEIPIVFEVVSRVVTTPFPIRFTIRNDSEKKETRVESDPISQDGLNVRLSNPNPSGPTSSIQPLFLIGLAEAKTELFWHFSASPIYGTNRFVVFAEFYELPSQAPIQTISTGAPS